MRVTVEEGGEVEHTYAGNKTILTGHVLCGNIGIRDDGQWFNFLHLNCVMRMNETRCAAAGGGGGGGGGEGGGKQ